MSEKISPQQLVEVASPDLEEALEEALKRIQGDSNESDEDNDLLTSPSRAVYPTALPSSLSSSTTAYDHIQSTRLLCMPHKTRHSSTISTLKFQQQQDSRITVKNSRDTVLSGNDFCHMVSERLEAISKERAYMKQQAQNQAREEGKSYKEIMSLEWIDSPDYIKKYISVSSSSSKIITCTNSTQQKREPSCSDSGLGNSYLGQSYSDLLYEDYSAADSVSYYSSEHSYHQSVSSIGDSFIKQPSPALSSYSSSISQSIPSLVHPSPLTTKSHHHQIVLPTSSSSSSISNQTYNNHLQSILPNSSTSSTCSSSTSSRTQQLLVAYSIDGVKSMFAKRVPIRATSLTLREFKDNVFARKGSYRFFFKSFCMELNDVIFEEISKDGQLLPLYEGKIVSHVERICDS